MGDSIPLWAPTNDERGWIMTGTGALACMLGASIIASDIPIRLIHRYRNFKIQDSTVFLSSSMALSFGVMEYSSLFSLLPESLSYLQKSGFSRRKAGFISTGCFIGGALAIMILSKILHRYMPSHAVGCDHSHDLEEGHLHDHHEDEERPSRSRVASTHGRRHPSHFPEAGNLHHFHFQAGERATSEQRLTEFTPLIESPSPPRPTTQERKLSVKEVPRVLKEFVLDRKANCSEDGTCFGYSDPCGQGCLVVVYSPTKDFRLPSTILRTNSSASQIRSVEADSQSASTAAMLSSRTGRSDSYAEDDAEDDKSHHHHIPTNIFLDLSFQTSIAIALHKVPEGFITYATNHVNSSLGLSVFIALLFHNLTEGFALALPIYLATKSRLRALIYSAILGGASPPLGAGIAALWFWVAGNVEKASPSTTLYGCMFAVTSGIMASVGISLFCEAMAFNHNRNLCVCFAFIGMGILGVTGSLSQQWKH